MYMNCKKIFLITMMGLLSSCAHQKDDFNNRSPESIYKEGMKLLKSESFTDAASEFKDIEMLFPYSAKAVDGQIMAAYAYYKAKSYSDALRELDVFEKYHPAHEYIPYAMYLCAMCLFMQIGAIGRDSKMAMDAAKLLPPGAAQQSSTSIPGCSCAAKTLSFAAQS